MDYMDIGQMMYFDYENQEYKRSEKFLKFMANEMNFSDDIASKNN